MYTYKVVAGPTNVKVTKGNEQAAFQLFEDTINREAKGGWEYHSMETLNVTLPPGCLNNQPNISVFYMLIFRKAN